MKSVHVSTVTASQRNLNGSGKCLGYWEVLFKYNLSGCISIYVVCAWSAFTFVQDPCIVGYTYLIKTYRCYMFDPVSLMTWDEARSSCMDDGGDLIGHETQNELDSLSSWMTRVLGLCIIFNVLKKTRYPRSLYINWYIKEQMMDNYITDIST